MSSAFEKSAEPDVTRSHRAEHVGEISNTCTMTNGELSPAPVAHDATREILHELSQPLTAICSYSEAAMNNLDASTAEAIELARIRDSLQQIINASHLAAGIIKRFRDVTPNRITCTSHHDISNIANRAVEMLALQIRDPGIHVINSIVPISVEVDDLQIQEVLINLVRNAIEAVRPQTGRIEISAVERSGYVELIVADNGPGIDVMVGNRLFHPMVSRKETGMGIGLAVSKSIVERHGGRIWCIPNTPSGARFHFTLPVPEPGQTKMQG